MFKLLLVTTRVFIIGSLVIICSILSFFGNYSIVLPVITKLIVFTAGFYYIPIKNKYLFDNSPNKIVIYNHSCIFDGFFLISCLYPFSIIIKESRASLITNIIKWGDGILIKNDGTGTSQLVSHINNKKRILMISPEGTTSNGKEILPFRTGAFVPLKPIQMVIFRYTNDNVCWGNKTTLKMLYDTLSQFTNYLSLEVLPVQYPLEHEGPKEYSNRIRNIMKQF